VLVRSVRYCWSTWLSFVRTRLKSLSSASSNISVMVGVSPLYFAYSPTNLAYMQHLNKTQSKIMFRKTFKNLKRL